MHVSTAQSVFLQVDAVVVVAVGNRQQVVEAAVVMSRDEPVVRGAALARQVASTFLRPVGLWK